MLAFASFTLLALFAVLANTSEAARGPPKLPVGSLCDTLKNGKTGDVSLGPFGDIRFTFNTTWEKLREFCQILPVRKA